MLRPAAQRLKNEHVERALEQLDPTLIAFPFSHGSRYSTPTGSSLSTGWLKAQRFRNQGGKHVQNVVEAWRCQHCGRKGRFAMSVSGLREARIRELGTPRLPAHT